MSDRGGEITLSLLGVKLHDNVITTGNMLLVELIFLTVVSHPFAYLDIFYSSDVLNLNLLLSNS